VAQAQPGQLASASLLGPAAADAALPLSISLRIQNPEELAALLVALQTPGSPIYHQWLTPAEFTARFAPSADEYAAVVEWLEQQGMTVTTSPNRLWIEASGAVAHAERAFAIRMSRYDRHGREGLATDEGPSVPAALAGLIDAVRLTTFPLADPLVQVAGPNGPMVTMAPKDIYVAYDIAPALANGIDGSGQTIAIVARSDFALSDVNAFQTQFGVPVRPPKKVFPHGNPGIGSPNFACQGVKPKSMLQQCIRNEEAEVVLDTEWAGAAAPGATVLVDVSNQEITQSLLDIVTNHTDAKIVTMSFDACERRNAAALRMMQPLYAQAAAQGQTVLVGTGDHGADDCHDGGAASINALSSDPNVVAVGGTALDPGFDGDGNATGYVSESVWNDVGASGGGASALVAKPAYQTGPGVPDDRARDTPDVALLASPVNSGYVIRVANQVAIVGGTSVGTPIWGGIVALLNNAAHTDALGALNPVLYQLGADQYGNGGPAVFHDVTVGDNGFNGVGGFAAGVAYDQATGWGSPDVAVLAGALAPPAGPCVGDCNADGRVTVDELITAVGILLGTAPASDCSSVACHGDAPVTVDCLVAAVNAALLGCGG